MRYDWYDHVWYILVSWKNHPSLPNRITAPTEAATHSPGPGPSPVSEFLRQFYWSFGMAVPWSLYPKSGFWVFDYENERKQIDPWPQEAWTGYSILQALSIQPQSTAPQKCLSSQRQWNMTSMEALTGMRNGMLNFHNHSIEQYMTGWYWMYILGGQWFMTVLYPTCTRNIPSSMWVINRFPTLHDFYLWRLPLYNLYSQYAFFPEELYVRVYMWLIFSIFQPFFQPSGPRRCAYVWRPHVRFSCLLHGSKAVVHLEHTTVKMERYGPNS